MARYARFGGGAGELEHTSRDLRTAHPFLVARFVVPGPLAAVHQATPEERKIWSLAAFGFATIYAALISINYYVQLAWVGPRLATGRVEGMEGFLFVPFDSFLYAVDILGYSFMSLATLCAARVFTSDGHERVVRWFLIANGFVLPFLLFQMYVHSLIWIAASWAVTFPGSTWSLAILFKRMPVGDRALLPLTAA